QTGTVVGSYSAVGTAGGIFGTFFTGFVLIAAFPTRPIVIAVGTALVIGGLALWGRFGRAGPNHTAARLVLPGGMFSHPGPGTFVSSYSCAVIRAALDRPGGRTLIHYQKSNSYEDLEDPTQHALRSAKVEADVIDTMLPGGPITA